MHKTNHVPKQTHINREPLDGCIIQASPACKWQNGLCDEVLHQKPSQKLIDEQASKAPDPVLPLPFGICGRNTAILSAAHEINLYHSPSPMNP
ncbi:hypothetical protein, partial [Candidatus Puniceispirillum sp.]|uniref:hypothetical protein n=1 Tax=Candidatus Puniceispirillum sp. TaxID=2026719 RepID=UPI003F69EB76